MLKSYKLFRECASGAETPTSLGGRRASLASGDRPASCISHVMYHTAGSPQQGPQGRGKPGGVGGSHLQVLLLPGEGVGESLCGLGSVLCHLGLDGVCDFLEHGVDLLQEATGLVNVIELQTRSGRGGVRVICWAVTLGIYSQKVIGPSHPTEMACPGNRALGEGGQSALSVPSFQINPPSSEFEESPSKMQSQHIPENLPPDFVLFQKR